MAVTGSRDVYWYWYRLMVVQRKLSNNSTLLDQLTRNLRRAYYAAVSYIDEQIGRILATINELGLAEDTIVSFLGDHGWQSGEHGEWTKHTNFELTAHAPLMIAVPGLTDQVRKNGNMVWV